MAPPTPAISPMAMKLIKEEVLGLLYFYQQQGYIVSYAVDSRNAGTINIIIRP
jgi:hypothetical protein